MNRFEKLKKISHVGSRQFAILGTSLIVGLLIILQSRAFTDFTKVIGRDSRADVFREIKILKNTNDDLNEEIRSLEDQLDKTANNEHALQMIRQDIAKYQLLTGVLDVYGTGITVKVNGNVNIIWLTDIVNELFGAGAEAIAINGIRITDLTAGFDMVPSGQVVLNGAVLKAPYEFSAIGDKKTLREALTQPQGIIQRLKQNNHGLEVIVEDTDNVSIGKVI